MQKAVTAGIRACTSAPTLALALALALSACGKEQPAAPPAPTVGVVTLTKESAELTNELPGRIAALETADVRPQITGVIRRRLFTEGSNVQAGQLLYEIEDSPYRAALAQAKGSLAVANATINSTALQAKRYKDLIAINAVSRQQYDDAAAAAQPPDGSAQPCRQVVIDPPQALTHVVRWLALQLLDLSAQGQDLGRGIGQPATVTTHLRCQDHSRDLRRVVGGARVRLFRWRGR